MHELVGTPAKVNFRSAQLVTVEGQNFGVHALAAIRLFCLVGDNDFIAGVDKASKLDLSAFSRARPATFEIPCAVQVWIWWSGKGEIVRQVFLKKIGDHPWRRRCNILLRFGFDCSCRLAPHLNRARATIVLRDERLLGASWHRSH